MPFVLKVGWVGGWFGGGGAKLLTIFAGIVEVGCKTCQKVTVCGPELSFKTGIKWCDGQKIGWELKRL